MRDATTIIQIVRIKLQKYLFIKISNIELFYYIRTSKDPLVPVCIEIRENRLSW